MPQAFVGYLLFNVFLSLCPDAAGVFVFLVFNVFLSRCPDAASVFVFLVV